MLTRKIYTTKPSALTAENFSPRNYDPVFLFVQDKLVKCPEIHSFLSSDVKSGSTPPYWFFRQQYEMGIPFIKTSAIRRDFINVNDLHFITPNFHRIQLKRSITQPNEVIFSMTGKYMGKAALCPSSISELNMSQNSVVLRCKTEQESAFMCVYLNSEIYQSQIRARYSITKQKYINQDRIKKLKILSFRDEHIAPANAYLQGMTCYYSSLAAIKDTISEFDKIFHVSKKSFDMMIDFKIPFKNLESKILTPQYYRKDFASVISKFATDGDSRLIDEYKRDRGDEIGSENYLSEGVPFIKTSDFLNHGVDYQSDHYCSEAIYEELQQEMQRGDILFTKDGKIGETAILLESAKIVISSGLVRLRPSTDDERYWLFLLLSSDYGKMFFTRWTVIASTMAHLRKDFFKDFKVPKLNDDVKDRLIERLRIAFEKKLIAFKEIEKAKEALLKSMHKEIEI